MQVLVVSKQTRLSTSRQTHLPLITDSAFWAMEVRVRGKKEVCSKHGKSKARQLFHSPPPNYFSPGKSAKLFVRNCGSIFGTQQVRYRGLIANAGLRFEYWQPGRYVDDLVDNPDAFVIRIVYWYNPPEYWDYLAFSEKVNFAIFRAFDEEGIRLSLPTALFSTKWNSVPSGTPGMPRVTGLIS